MPSSGTEARRRPPNDAATATRLVQPWAAAPRRPALELPGRRYRGTPRSRATERRSHEFRDAP